MKRKIHFSKHYLFVYDKITSMNYLKRKSYLPISYGVNSETFGLPLLAVIYGILLNQDFFHSTLTFLLLYFWVCGSNITLAKLIINRNGQHVHHGRRKVCIVSNCTYQYQENYLLHFDNLLLYKEITIWRLVNQEGWSWRTRCFGGAM